MAKMPFLTFQSIVLALLVIAGTASLGGKCVVALVRHVVGGDRGWDPSTDIASWSSGRIFRVGDEIWFTYTAAQGLVAELQSREEYESCNASKAIKMYTDGLHTVPLEREGIRYFVSTDPQNCKTGLKLHVEVLPTATSTTFLPNVEADGPSTPSASIRHQGHSILMLIVVMLGVTVGLPL
ncbi:mavicyanin-like [Senna tora]|uniref:Mavicyanin-like n=1 Tax=Senna tora TaxID=362788 RepID=A0A834SJR1_9FABA|nr:mavicyanin-like [Senna tora]